MRFGRSHPGIVALAMSTSKPQRVKQNVESVAKEVPYEFWQVLKDEGLIERVPDA
jgi:D-threo-aldose 1-dehydrogenase